MANTKIRHRILILGDQLDIESGIFKNFDAKKDELWMAELSNESTHVWSHKARSVLFLSAMRHFAQELENKDYPLRYLKLSDRENFNSFSEALAYTQKIAAAEKLIVTEPGDYRVLKELQDFSRNHSIPLKILSDESFLVSTKEFQEYAREKKVLRMEFFYRWMRSKSGILMKNNKPVGDAWNFDKDNRQSFGKNGPSGKLNQLKFAPDKITQEVMQLVSEKFPKNPGSLNNFNWPVNREQALKALEDFIKNHLPIFGAHQDAMWSDEAFLHHSLLSSSLNLKLLRPLEVIKAAEASYKNKKAPLESVEGFIRQILGWREYVRGIYWLHMPEYLERNALKAENKLPDFYWSGKTSMNCLSQVITQTLEHAYAHHIQRLMVSGLYSLLIGVKPKEIHEWYLAVYVDAVDWVEVPNTIGMSQFADAGVMASKPYIASGKYINRMSNYCKNCRYSPDLAHGEKACPFTTLFWDFVDRHRKILERNPRLGAQVKNWDRLSESDRQQIKKRAKIIKDGKLELCS